MDDLEKVLMDAISMINYTTKCFNQQKDKEAYKQLELSLNEITKVMELIYIYNQRGFDLQDRYKKIESILVDIFHAMQGNDTVLITDILEYELAQEFTNFKNNMI